METDARQEWTYCVYRPDAATGLGAAALALLLVGQAVAAVSSRCFCCGAALRPGGARACALILFLSSWYQLRSPLPLPHPLHDSALAAAAALTSPREADARAPRVVRFVSRVV